MSTETEVRLSVRPGPRPDPLPVRGAPAWTAHASWVATLALTIGAGLLVAHRELGLLACGAALFGVAAQVVIGRLQRTCHALHFGAGLLVLALAKGAEAAGEFALPLGLLLAGDLAARTAARFVRMSVVPLAGCVPWRFRSSYRQLALWFATGGLAAGLLLVVAAPGATVKVAAIALFPLALRSYADNLLPRLSARSLWALVACGHAAALAAFVPAYGPIAAAWTFVASETVLFAISALLIARSTGVAPFPTAQLAGAIGAVLVLCALSLPGNSEWPFLVSIVFGAACGALLFPRRTL